ncbi:MAG: PmoA family protein, partial [Candidatus Hydrogenedentes bacterium]|nr:PmoA family protein [Candidatus Hydrogenedentota bacterium]
ALSTMCMAADSDGLTIKKTDGKVRVEIGGQLFTEYCYQNVPRPYFYPVIGPTGDCMVRRWPIEDVNKDESRDHVHHKSLWFTHGDVNGIDFWGEKEGHGTIVHDKFLEVSSKNNEGVIRSTNKWLAPDGHIVCTDTRTHRFYNRPEGRFIDFEIVIHASNGQVVFGDTKEGSMAIRLAPTLRLKGKVGQGHIINSAGDTDDNTWGKRAAWCDYYGPINGHTVGVAIFDSPSDPRYPTWWHVRNYGLFAANPFGVHYFEGKPEGTGAITVPAGDDLTLKYRFFFHKGDTEQANVAKEYADYLNQIEKNRKKQK